MEMKMVRNFLLMGSLVYMNVVLFSNFVSKLLLGIMLLLKEDVFFAFEFLYITVNIILSAILVNLYAFNISKTTMSGIYPTYKKILRKLVIQTLVLLLLYYAFPLLISGEWGLMLTISDALLNEYYHENLFWIEFLRLLVFSAALYRKA